MFLKTKKLFNIFLIFVVAASSFASSFFVYPVQEAHALICDSQVLVSKLVANENETFKVYASANNNPGSGVCPNSLMDERNTFVFEIWDSTSRITATKYYDLELQARLKTVEGRKSLDAGRELKVSDILPQAKVDTDLFIYAFIKINGVKGSELDGSARKITIKPGQGENGETTDIGNDDVQSPIIKEIKTPPTQGSGECAAFSRGEVEAGREDVPIVLTTETSQGETSSLNINFSVYLPPESLANCASDAVNFKFSVWIGLPHATTNPQDSYQGYQLVAGGISSQPLKDSQGKFVGYTGGKNLIPGVYLNAEEKQKVANGELVPADIRVTAARQEGSFIPTTYSGVQVGQLVKVAFTNDPTKVSKIRDGFVPIESPSATTGDGGKSPVTTIADFLAGIIGDIIGFIQLLIFKIFGVVVLPLITTLISIPTYTDNFAAVILPGWELLRNLSNIFFILVLLVIGLGTLFRVQGYQYKNLLLKLIFAAFMVNFSLVLTQSFLAVAETAQFQFLPQGKEGEKVINVIANELMIAPLNQNTLTPEVASKNLSEGLSRLVFPFFYLSLTFMAFVVFVSLAFFLVLRMIVIWILLMASPIAIVATVIPQTKKYATTWLSYLVQYGFFVAILGFFLNVTAYLAQRQEGVLKALGSQGKEASFEEFLSRIATNIFVMGFLVAGLKVAGGMKVIGASTLNKFATKAGKLPFDFLKFGGERLFEGTQNVTGVTVDPRIWKKDWDSYLKRRDKEKEDRLKDRRSGKKGFVGKLVPGRVGVGSPEQLFENLLTTDGWKKIILTPNQIFNRQQAKVRAGAAGMMTDEDRLKEKEKSDKAALSAKGAKELKDEDKLTGQTFEAERFANGLEIEAGKLRDAAKTARGENRIGDAEMLESEAERLEAKAKQIDLLEDSMSIEDLSEGLSVDNKQVMKDVAAAIKNGIEKDIDEYNKTMEELKEKGLQDDKLRKQHGFSEFDADGKDKPGYRELSADAKKAIAEKAAAFGEKADNLRFKSLINEAKEKRALKAEINKEYDEKEYETGDDLAYETRQVMRGNAKDKKERIEVLLERAAKVGATEDVLKAISKIPRGNSFNDYVAIMKDLKVQAGFSDKDILKLVYALDKKHKAGKDFGFAFAVQRIGGELSWRDQADHNKKVAESLSRLSNREFVKLPPNALVEKSKKDGNTVINLHEETTTRINNFKASEAKGIESALSPETAYNVMNSENKHKLNFMNEAVRASNSDARKIYEVFASKAAQHTKSGK